MRLFSLTRRPRFMMMFGPDIAHEVDQLLNPRGEARSAVAAMFLRVSSRVWRNADLQYSRQFVFCSTQTHVIDVSSHAIQTVSEEGSSHLTDDGWAVTQRQISQIQESIVGLYRFCRPSGQEEVSNEVNNLHIPEQMFQIMTS